MTYAYYLEKSTMANRLFVLWFYNLPSGNKSNKFVMETIICIDSSTKKIVNTIFKMKGHFSNSEYVLLRSEGKMSEISKIKFRTLVSEGLQNKK